MSWQKKCNAADHQASLFRPLSSGNRYISMMFHLSVRSLLVKERSNLPRLALPPLGLVQAYRRSRSGWCRTHTDTTWCFRRRGSAKQRQPPRCPAISPARPDDQDATLFVAVSCSSNYKTAFIRKGLISDCKKPKVERKFRETTPPSTMPAPESPSANDQYLWPACYQNYKRLDESRKAGGSCPRRWCS
jgi:hypothetical protein